MDLKSFGQTLRKFRKDAGLTQEALAHRVHVSADLISKWERAYEREGRRWKPDRPSVIRLIKIFTDHLDSDQAQTWAATAGYNLTDAELQESFPSSLAKHSSTIPRQLPPLPAIHVNRPMLEEFILEQLKKIHTLVVCGPGGAGKTTLAACITQQLADEFPDGVIWVEMQPEDSITKAQDWIARSLGATLEIDSISERFAQLRSWLYGQQCLIILDDVWTLADLNYLQFGSETCRLLVTTRDAKVADILNAYLIRLPGLTAEEGTALLNAWGERRLEDRLAFELITRLGGLPLALSLSGAQLRSGVQLSELVALFRHKFSDLGLLDLDDPRGRAESLNICFDLSYSNLSRPVQQKFRQLSYFAGTFDTSAVAGMWQVEPQEVGRLLHKLWRLALIERDPQGYRLHPLLRDYAWQKLAARPHRVRLGHHHHAAYHIRYKLYHPRILGDASQPVPNLDHSWNDIVTAVKWAATREPQLAAWAAFLAYTERPALLNDVGANLIMAVADYLTQLDSDSESAFMLELLGTLQLLHGEFKAGLDDFNDSYQLSAAMENWLTCSRTLLRLAGVYLLEQKPAEAAAAARKAQSYLEKGLPLIPENPDAARWLFYWFNMVYNPLTRWPDLPEADVAHLADLADQTEQPLLKARALHIYRLWCTATARPAPTRDLARELALQAYELWRTCGRMDRADDEISWTNYHLTGRYSQRVAARYAKRRSNTTPPIGYIQIQQARPEGVRWWLGATPAQRIAWLSRMLPRYLHARNASKPALPPNNRARQWIDDIFSVSVFGNSQRRLSLITLPPPGHILNGPEWHVLTGQKALPVTGTAGTELVARYLSALEAQFS